MINLAKAIRAYNIMTFKELQDLIDKSFGATRLADIAKELDVLLKLLVIGNLEIKFHISTSKSFVKKLIN